MSIGDCKILNNVNSAWICSFLEGDQRLSGAIISATHSVTNVWEPFHNFFDRN